MRGQAIDLAPFLVRNTKLEKKNVRVPNINIKN
jgi:hypothetical protein